MVFVLICKEYFSAQLKCPLTQGLLYVIDQLLTEFLMPRKFKMLTQENLAETYEDLGNQRLEGYLEATKDLLPVIKKIVNTSRSFEELKSQLTQFQGERKKFITVANEFLDVMRIERI